MADEWIIATLQKTRADVEAALADYRFDIAAQLMYEFTWNQFCDWYLELTKPVLNNDEASEEEKRGTRHTLVNVLEQLMRLLHPFMPYITESIWQQVAPLCGIEVNESASVMSQNFVNEHPELIKDNILNDIAWLKKCIVGVRNIRGEMDISPNRPLDVLFKNANTEDKARAEKMDVFLTRLGKLSSITHVKDGDNIPASATAIVGEMEILIPMAGLIDKEAELARIDKALEKLNKDIQRVEGKLANEKFVANAPEAVIAKERSKCDDFQSQIRTLSTQRETISNL